MDSDRSEAHLDQQGLVRSDFWFVDGNIVLISGHAAFKVHRGQLERHSEIFSDLFSIPQPAGQELLDGCLWVELHDCPSDIFYFLRALYDGLYFKKPHANDFPAIAAVLRLSSKYLVEHLRQRCLARLELDWPSTLDGWDRREQSATDAQGRYTPRESVAHPVLVLNLALDLGLPTLLPAAFYDLSRYGPSKIFSGAPAPPLAIVVPSAASVDPPSQLYLSDVLLYRTFLGRESSQRYVAFFIDTQLMNRPISSACANASHKSGRVCRESFYFIMLNILRSVGGIATGRDGDVLFTLVQAMDMLSRTDFSDGQTQCSLKICGSCKLEFAASVRAAREEVWGLIPGWFGLEEPVQHACVE